MPDQFCFQCNKKIGWLSSCGLDAVDSKKKRHPKGMTNDDKICIDCFNDLPKSKESRAIEKEKERIWSINKQEEQEQKILKEKEQQENSKKYDEIKLKFQKHGTIMYKDDYCAILKKIEDLSFIKAFSELTREGYRMMAQDEGGSFHLGIASVGAGSYYFFQKIEYITRTDI